MLKLHELKLYYKSVNMTLPVYLQNLPLILSKTFHKFKSQIHDYIHKNMARHDFAKRSIRYDILCIINNTAFNINKQNYNTQFTRMYVMQHMFYRITKYSAHYQIAIYVDSYNNQCTILYCFIFGTSVNVVKYCYLTMRL